MAEKCLQTARLPVRPGFQESPPRTFVRDLQPISLLPLPRTAIRGYAGTYKVSTHYSNGRVRREAHLFPTRLGSRTSTSSERRFRGLGWTASRFVAPFALGSSGRSHPSLRHKCCTTSSAFPRSTTSGLTCLTGVLLMSIFERRGHYKHQKSHTSPRTHLWDGMAEVRCERNLMVRRYEIRRPFVGSCVSDRRTENLRDRRHLQ